MKDLTILLPTRNEREGLRSTLLDFAFLERRPEILVVDTNSTDGTLDIAKDFGVKVVEEPRKGKGLALITGFQNVQTPYVIMMDADGTYPVKYIGKMYGFLEQGWDVVVGCREFKSDGSMSRSHHFGNLALSGLATCLYGQKIKDVCTGMKGFRTEKVNGLGLECSGFEIEAEIFARSSKNGLSIKEMDIPYGIRKGEAKLNGWKDGLKIGMELLSERFT